MDLLRGVLPVRGWDREDLFHALLSSWVEMNFNDDVEEGSDQRAVRDLESGEYLL